MELNMENNLNNFKNIEHLPVTISVELGRVKMPIRELLKLAQGAIVSLDKVAGEPLNFYVNGKLFGTCEVVQVNDKFGIRIVEIFSKNKGIK